MRFFALATLALSFAISSCTCGGAPGELRPLVADLVVGATFEDCDIDEDCTVGTCDTSIAFCTEAREATLDFSARNVGDTTVKISSVHIDAVADHEADLESFTQPQHDLDQLEKDQVVSIRFTYQTPPDGSALEAMLVIDSDASNPKLEVPIHVLEFNPSAAEGEGEGAIEGEGEGEGE